VPEAASQRIIVDSQCLWFKEIAEIIKEAYGQFYEINTEEAKECLVPDFQHLWNKDLTCSNEKSKKIFGTKYMEVKQSVIEMIDTLIKYG